MKLKNIFLVFLLGGCYYSANADEIKHPFMIEKETRTPGQLIQDIRSGKSRVTEMQFLERLRLQGYNIKLLDDLTDPKRVEVKDCDWITSPPIEYIDQKGGFRTHTRSCKSGEKILWLDGRPAISLYCGNVVETPVTIPVVDIQQPKKRKCGVVAQDITVPQVRAGNNYFVFPYLYPYGYYNGIRGSTPSVIHHHRQIVCEQ